MPLTGKFIPILNPAFPINSKSSQFAEHCFKTLKRHNQQEAPAAFVIGVQGKRALARAYQALTRYEINKGQLHAAMVHGLIKGVAWIRLCALAVGVLPPAADGLSCNYEVARWSHINLLFFSFFFSNDWSHINDQNHK